jgi:hypothetical protein
MTLRTARHGTSNQSSLRKDFMAEDRIVGDRPRFQS